MNLCLQNISLKFVIVPLSFCLFLFTHCAGERKQTKQKDHLQNFKTSNPSHLDSIVFAGGCFWCTESDFEKFPGVIEAISGYTGGKIKNPSYKQVSQGSTQHLEAVLVYFDRTKINDQKLIRYFFKTIDPTDDKGQFADRGQHYTTAIFYYNKNQKQIAQSEKIILQQSQKFSKDIYTVIRPTQIFYPAEDYHQNYYQKNPKHYQSYRLYSGRTSFIKKYWGNIYEFSN